MTKAFILGNPRSGTSLLRIMLNSHPEIAAPPECGFLHWWFGKYKNWTLQDSNNPSAVQAFVEDVIQSRKMETWSLDQDALISLIRSGKPATYAALGELIYVAWANQSGKEPKVIIDKNNYYIRHLHDLPKLWPDARFIFLIRDGRDVACSYLAMQSLATDSPYKPKLPATPSAIATEWVENNKAIAAFLSQLKPTDSIQLRYEDLILQTHDQLSRLCQFLGLGLDEKMLAYYAYNDEPASTLDWKKKTMEKPDADNVGKYASVLTVQELAQFNSIAGEMLSQYGYGNQ
jgi:hypothetical protein